MEYIEYKDIRDTINNIVVNTLEILQKYKEYTYFESDTFKVKRNHLILFKGDNYISFSVTNGSYYFAKKKQLVIRYNDKEILVVNLLKPEKKLFYDSLYRSNDIKEQTFSNLNTLLIKILNNNENINKLEKNEVEEINDLIYTFEI